jgi:hypothetical protein
VKSLKPGENKMGAAAAAAVIRAAKASGVIVKIQPADFAALAAKVGDPLVVAARGGFFNQSFNYLMSYKGLAFFTRSPSAIALPPATELVSARQIWIP